MMASDRDLFGGGACIAQHMMGPDAVAILQELLQAQPLRPGWRRATHTPWETGR
ncbi:MAG: hypothetical protein PHP07_00645 [Eubacteriales bacterium]|nr:hypothetical protein [Eubacteriales bacterium]